ncbi:hypothetical protein ACLMJK_007148 [Lecanora helva]
MEHRTRSHPALTPLTTLPSPTTSSSYIYPSTSIPSTPSLLSRPSSATRLRPLRSQPTAIPTSKSSSALTKNVKRKAKLRKYSKEDDDDWITRTASTLTLTRLEEKGQSWLAARHSSTSLTGEADGELDEVDPLQAEITARDRFFSSRGTDGNLPSHVGNTGSRGSSFGVAGDGARDDYDDVAGRLPEEEKEGEVEDIRPDFVDIDEEEEDEGADDREIVDESEMKKVVMSRVGGWVDWAVGWMDMRDGEGDDEDDDDDDDNKEGNAQEAKNPKHDLDPVELEKRLQKKKEQNEESEERGVPAPPKGEGAGAWSDAKWLLRVATMAALE